jgi:hypothetical protein
MTFRMLNAGAVTTSDLSRARCALTFLALIFAHSQLHAADGRDVPPTSIEAVSPPVIWKFNSVNVVVRLPVVAVSIGRRTAISPNGKWLVTGGSPQVPLDVLRTSDGVMLRVLPRSSKAIVYSVAISSRNKAAVGMNSGQGTFDVAIYDLE